MRWEPAGQDRIRLLPHPFEDLEEVRHLARIVPGLRHVLDPVLVSLSLVVAAVLKEQQASSRLGKIAELCKLGRDNAAQTESQV